MRRQPEVERTRPRSPQSLAGPVLPRAFYERETEEVARDLIGKILMRGDRAGVIVETEAYPGGDDKASHSAAGLTPRTRVIFGAPGHAYVYLSYGMHFCFNVVVQPAGTPGCVLIRGLRGINLTRTTDGPGKLTQALGITLDDYGADLTRGLLTIREPRIAESHAIEVTPRIGITRSADLPLRFVAR